MKLHTFRAVALAAMLAVAATLGVPRVQAQVPGVTISNDGFVDLASPAYNLGYSFIANGPFSVVSLGVWDYLGDGLLNSHQVGLWNSSGLLLASAVVPAGTGAVLDDGFRYTDITPFALTSGAYYYVGATFAGHGDDPWTADVTSLVTAPMITYDSRRYETGSALVFPDRVGSNTIGYWGGNVMLTTDVVPEPGTMTLLATGLIGLVGVGRRRRKA